MRTADLYQDPPLILVVDDDKPMRILLRRAMEQEGYQVAEASEGEQALAAYTRLHPDIVLLDALMPVMDGFTCCAQLQKLPGGDRTPVLIITGLEDQESVNRAFVVGATDYVTKPLQWAVLRQRVRRLLEQSHLYRQLEKSNQELQSGISELKRTEKALSESQQMLQLVMDNIPQFIFWKDSNSVYLGCNRNFAQTVGLDSPENIIGKTDYDLLWKPEQSDWFRECDARIMETDTPEYHTIEPQLQADGKQTWVDTNKIPLHDCEGNVVGILGTYEDITDRKRAEEQLLHDALHDRLTGLPNRTLFMARLGNAVERAKGSENYLFAVLFLDLDRFKVVNDSLGHLIGDQLLIAIARTLEACVRRTDTVARLGGDEFTILLENIQNLEDAIQVANRIQKELTKPFNLGGHEVFSGVSIGIALSTTGYDRPQDLLRDADTTMYRAKALGKGRFVVFDRTMHAQAMTLLQLETDLRRALERQEFLIHYQPIVSLLSGRITGFEALLRWQHPSRGLISPAEFIPVAEETGLIVPITWLVLREACRQMRAWQVQFSAKAPLTISVNLSGKQFVQPNLIEQIEQILHETGLDARSLALEITETALIQNAEAAAIILKQLRSKGVQLFLDDFGTGYSSLSYLHRFPITTLKIDRDFVSRMGDDGENSEIVRTIVTLAHSLGMNVTAEGVETAAQLAQLGAIRCEHGQGYFFSKPVDCIQAEALIKAELEKKETLWVHPKRGMSRRNSTLLKTNFYRQRYHQELGVGI